MPSSSRAPLMKMISRAIVSISSLSSPLSHKAADAIAELRGELRFARHEYFEDIMRKPRAPADSAYAEDAMARADVGFCLYKAAASPIAIII